MVKCKTFAAFDPYSVPSPCFVVDEVALEENLKTLKLVADASGAKVLLALKAFSMYSLAPLINKYLSGTCASGLHEAKLGYEEFGGHKQGKLKREVHTYSAGFKEDELLEVLEISDHVVFNSVGQWMRYKTHCLDKQKTHKNLKFGLRVNPEHSEGATELYDPCAPCSRLGITYKNFSGVDLEGISGIHFHTLCEQKFEPLDRTLSVIEQQFADVLEKVAWVNFGGGHHITALGYNIEALIKRIKTFREKYNVQVYLEPGEAIAIHAGILVSEVVDLTCNTKNLAILDTSATCHMPDTLEMPYRAEIFNASEAEALEYTYRLGGQTCLAGDVIGDYSFKQVLEIGQRLIFDDMAHYTMVKTTTFNGINLPSIAIWNSHTNKVRIVKQFAYDDFKSRL